MGRYGKCDGGKLNGGARYRGRACVDEPAARACYLRANVLIPARVIGDVTDP